MSTSARSMLRGVRQLSTMRPNAVVQERGDLSMSVKASSLERNASRYTSVIAFGGSYVDNGHPRPDAYKFTLKSPPYYRGRHCNGLVSSEYTAKSLQAPLTNYAYAGAHATNSPSLCEVPSTQDQIHQYIADLEAKRIDRGHGRVLHIMWTGIHPLKSIIEDAIRDDVPKGNDDAFHEAKNRIHAQVEEVTKQVKMIRQSALVNSLRSDVILLPIPALEMLPYFQRMCDEKYGSDKEMIGASYRCIKHLADLYNQGLMLYARENARPLSLSSGWLKTYDIPALWRKMAIQPDQYGFSPVESPAIDGQPVWDMEQAGEPDVEAASADDKQGLQWDSLHPTTRVHKIIGHICFCMATEALDEA